MPRRSCCLPVPLPCTLTICCLEGMPVKAGLSRARSVRQAGADRYRDGCQRTQQSCRLTNPPVAEVPDAEPVFLSVWRLLLGGRDYYHHPIGDVLAHALPIMLRCGAASAANVVPVCHRNRASGGLISTAC